MILCLLILATVVFVSPLGVVNYFQEIFITCVETVPGLWLSVPSGTHGTHNVITLGWGLIKLSLMELLAPWASSHHQPWPLAWLNTPILWSYILVYSPPSGVSPSSVSPVVASVMVSRGLLFALFASLLAPGSILGLSVAPASAQSSFLPKVHHCLRAAHGPGSESFSCETRFVHHVCIRFHMNMYVISSKYVCVIFSAHKFTSSGAQNVRVVSTTEILELS